MPMSVLSVALAQRISLALGALYVLIGVLGFTPAVTYPAEGPGQVLLLGVFAVNPVHNLAHLALGGAMIWAGQVRPQWDMLTRTLAVVFLLLVGASLVAPLAEGIAINAPDTVLHAVTALAFGYFATKVPEDDFVPTR